MKRIVLIAVAMIAILSMASVEVKAQGRHGGPRHEMYGGGRHDGPRHDYGHHGGPRHDYGHHPGMHGDYGHHHMGHHHGAPRLGRDGYVYGWEGRVRYMPDGRWGYYRDNRWYYYDTYFAPDYYYAQPVHVFHGHIHPGRVAGAAVVGAAVGAMIGTMMR